MIHIETERLVLRNVAAKDAEVMFDYRNNEICAKYQRGQTKDLNGIRELIQKRENDEISEKSPFFVAVALKTTDEMIGEIVVMPNELTFSLGYTFHYAHHRKGFAHEARSVLIELLHKASPQWEFICFTDPNNTPSMALLLKLGYENLGYLPSKESQIFGKWITKESENEIANIVKR